MGQMSSPEEFLKSLKQIPDDQKEQCLHQAIAILQDLHGDTAKKSINDHLIPSALPPNKAEIEKVCRGTGHNFNGVLANIRGTVEITQMMVPDLPDKVNNAFEKIIALVERGHNSTDLVRQFGRTLSYEKEHADFSLFMKRIVNDMRMNYNITYAVPLTCPEGLRAFADIIQLESLFMLMTKNSLQAIAENETESPQITVSVDADEQAKSVTIRFSDNGEGIAPDVDEKVYFPFYTTRKATEGMGLGMSIVKQIVWNHDGKIHYTSEQTKGTTFSIWLPILE